MGGFCNWLSNLSITILCIILLFGCAGRGGGSAATPGNISRDDSLPVTALKATPASDMYPPVLHSGEFGAPIPLPGPVNTAGAEDSPFIPYGGGALYFFFTPDPGIPAEKQLFDNVSGIWVSEKKGGAWGEPSRVLLQDDGKLALDGCEFVSGDSIWFCSAREGYAGINWFSAERSGGLWAGWEEIRFPAAYQVGELHLSADGTALYFHSSRDGGKGGLDIWESKKEMDSWQEPVNLAPLNTGGDEGWPCLNKGGDELWFTRIYEGSPAIYRSRLFNGSWSMPELIISSFAGEPTLDENGDLYFVHHYFRDGKMLEADIYIASRKNPPAE